MSTYKTIHTLYGLNKIAQASASGNAINLIRMAVGDGNGHAVEPSDTQTALVRERYRADVNRVYQNPSIPTSFFCEMIIPVTVGNFTLREVGVFDSDGGLFAVGNLPGMYKPVLADGVYADTIVRMQFSVADADVITLQIDPNIAVASQSWVLNTITMGQLLPGGTTGQQLAKASNEDGDVVWVSPSDINVSVDTIEETQTLAAGQTVVDLAATTVRGLALYINGARLRRDQWTADPLINTRLSLAVSYPDGTRLICAQNEPTGDAPAPLERTKNLSDLQNSATARENLGVYSKDEAKQFAPVSFIGFFARDTAPVGWLKANGAAISRTAYAELFAAIGTLYGDGDGFNTFNLPNPRGRFFRAWDDGFGIDDGRIFGSYQSDAIQNITGTFNSVTGGYTASGAFLANGPQMNHINAPISGKDAGLTFDASRVVRTAGETRPANAAYLACIKY